MNGLINAAASSLASTIGLHVTRRAFLRAAAAAEAAAVVVACSRAAEEEEQEEQEAPDGVSLSAFARGAFEQDITVFTAAWGELLLLLMLRRALPPFQKAPERGPSPRMPSESPRMQ